MKLQELRSKYSRFVVLRLLLLFGLDTTILQTDKFETTFDHCSRLLCSRKIFTEFQKGDINAEINTEKITDRTHLKHLKI